MERRKKAVRSKRIAAHKRREQTKLEAEKLSMGAAWATIKFVDGEGYNIINIHNNDTDAKEEAKTKTRGAMEDSTYLNKPYTVIFAVPVLKDKKYIRNKDYYANLRNGNMRTVTLWETEQEAKSVEDEKFIGGPISLRA